MDETPETLLNSREKGPSGSKSRVPSKLSVRTCHASDFVYVKPLVLSSLFIFGQDHSERYSRLLSSMSNWRYPSRLCTYDHGRPLRPDAEGVELVLHSSDTIHAVKRHGLALPTTYVSDQDRPIPHAHIRRAGI